MRPALRLVLLAAIAAALGAGVWLAIRGTAPDRRDLGALVTVGGDLAHDALHPALDLTRMSAAEEAGLGAAIDAQVHASMPVGGEAATEAYLARVLSLVAAAISVVPEMLRRYLETHPPADQRMEAVRRALKGHPDLWRGDPRYIGRANLTARRSLADGPLNGEWITRAAAPD